MTVGSPNAELLVWQEIVAAWWAHFKDEEVSAERLLPVAITVLSLKLGRGHDRVKQVRLEQFLHTQRAQVIGAYRVTPNRAVRGQQRWRLLRLPFVPSDEWQVLPEGFVCPPGGEFKIDLEAGVTRARWPGMAEEVE